MAFLGHFIPRQQKCWSFLSVPLVNVSTQHFCRYFSQQTADTSTTDYPLIQEAAINQESRVRGIEPKTFEELFKKSAFVSLGNPKGKVVVGTIKKVVDDDIYIDFGWKFPCVCPLPSEGSRSFVRGRKVRILIKELELATKFLGSDTEVTLNEADCVLLGLYSPQPVGESAKQAPRLKTSQAGSDKPQIRETISEIFSDSLETYNNKEKVENTKE